MTKKSGKSKGFGEVLKNAKYRQELDMSLPEITELIDTSWLDQPLLPLTPEQGAIAARTLCTLPYTINEANAEIFRMCIAFMLTAKFNKVQIAVTVQEEALTYVQQLCVRFPEPGSL